MDRTLKQRFRQPFGFYMENLIGGNFALSGIFAMYHAHSHAFEWGLDLNDGDLIQLKSLLDILGKNTQTLKNHVLDILKGKNSFYSKDYVEIIKKAFSTKDRGKLFDKKITLLSGSNLVSSNIIELLRIQDHKLIVSEIKSQYGPKVDYRIEFEKGQIYKLSRLANKGINVSLIYCIALPIPMFVEIPFTGLYDKFLDFEDFNGKEFTSDNWSDLRIRIPKEFRKEEKFTKIDKSLYSFKDEMSLFRTILDAFPDKFTRLEKFLG